MSEKNPYVLCIGVANVDVIAHVDTGFLVRHRVDHATSTLMRSEDILGMIGDMKDVLVIPGGCAANTSCGVAAQGVETIFTGMIRDDEYGRIFRDDFTRYGVQFNAGLHPEKATSICLTLVTPDKDRSFIFSPGAASWFLAEEHLPDPQPGRPVIIYTETNLFRMTAGTTRQSMLHAVVDKYHGDDAQIILNLIDTEITTHHRNAILDLIHQKKLSYIVSNSDELTTLFSTKTLEDAFEKAQQSGQVFITTLGKDGAVIIEPGNIRTISGTGIALEDIIDTVGAGDQFSAGFIAGLARGKDLDAACLEGINKAIEVLGIAGARPKIAA